MIDMKNEDEPVDYTNLIEVIQNMPIHELDAVLHKVLIKDPSYGSCPFDMVAINKRMDGILND
jgi:hypothetical protein